MRKFNLLVMLLLGCFLQSCSNNPASPEARELNQLEKRLVQADNKFSFKLFQEIANYEDASANVFISPLSVSMALGMTLNGADGETRAAMEQTLEFAGMTTDEINQSYRSLIDLLTQLDPKVVFEIANSIWYRQGWTFKESFLETNRSFFDAVVQGLDFDDPASVDIINGWVSDKTHEKIEKIIQAIDPLTVMFLINAIYFNGTWTYEFDKEMTADDHFTLPDASSTPCKMMVQTGKFNYLETEDFQAIDLPYGDGLFSMTIFLPRPELPVDNFISDFNQSNWDAWTSKFEADSVTLELPKFKVEYEIKLNDVLTALGMGIAFDEHLADFTGMHEPDELYISFVKHKTFVEVDEEGTEAAAVTVVAIAVESEGPGRDIRFMRVDRPFVFVIRENHSGTLLFMGKITNPTFEEN